MDRIQIEKRLQGTVENQKLNVQALNKVQEVRKECMGGSQPSVANLQWMVRELVGALTFKGQVLNGWVEGDLLVLKKLDAENPVPKPIAPVPLADTIPEAELDAPLTIPTAEGYDKIKAIIEGGNGNAATRN